MRKSFLPWQKKKEEIARLEARNQELENRMQQERMRVERERLASERRIAADEERRKNEALQRQRQEIMRREIYERQERELRERAEIDRQERVRRDRLQREREERARRLRLVSPDSLRSLRELIRERYALDVQIWADRKVRRADRKIVEGQMEKADAVLAEIWEIIGAWEDTQQDGIWSPTEWALAKEIRRRLLADGKRWWVGNPPWEED